MFPDPEDDWLLNALEVRDECPRGCEQEEGEGFLDAQVGACDALLEENMCLMLNATVDIAELNVGTLERILLDSGSAAHGCPLD